MTSLRPAPTRPKKPRISPSLSVKLTSVNLSPQTITPYVYMYMQIFGGGNTVTERNAGLGAAIGVLLSVCVVIVFTICNRVIKDDDLEF